MKKLIIIIALLVTSLGFGNNTLSVKQLRVLYIKAIENSNLADELYDKLQYENSNALIVGYKGAIEAIIAKHAWNPYNKIKYLNKSQVTLAKAIAAAPSDAELRFLRYTIQFYIPEYLGYSNDLDKDKKVILKYASSAVKEVREVIVQFFTENKLCTDKELKVMKG
ncbi:MAG: hypothetical protein SGJ04_02900 [Bacteroidota bacterium]|nr:hypothetical protein [Bacteroidota bacterium]